ncbi:NYN domain-containing protein [Acidovorax sp. FJL06]|uniref:NYN domain-containing protein n=1 Tax=Acidovorax sp. FJL06 TaxID=2153365 RepID=UPI000F58AE63|nr:NYN domain-containing protein [Acidovorax sp. FJL06]RQO80684.1 NYN domain protein [Acidovorax sp. FJL06]
MASPSDNSISMALFCDFENVALGVRDAQYEKFDIRPILERLLLKGSIVVKKAYCDWERYKGFKATMHEANFELIEIPHVRQSGKNSADIRLVVDALDLCYTKSHVNTFVIISGDSDFSPLVSKLRENNKQVIGVGVKQSTSDLLIANCDEFIFYDDLVREKQRALARRQNPGAAPAPRRTPEEERHRKETQEVRRAQGVELAVETFDALTSERGDSGKIWASVLKEAIKRRKPDFSEGYYGFRTFGNLLEEAQARGLLEFGRDEKSGAYVFRSLGAAAGSAPDAAGHAEAPAERQGAAGYFRHDFHAVASVPADAGGEGGGRGGRSRGRRGEGAARSGAPQPADARPELSADGRAEPAFDARDEVLPERPGGRYFNQPAPVLAPTGAGGGVEEGGRTLAIIEHAEASEPAAPAARAEPADTAEVEPAASASAPAPRRTANTPRKAGGRKAAGVAVEPGPDAPAASAPVAASAPAQAAKAPARKPRSTGKKTSEPAE